MKEFKENKKQLEENILKLIKKFEEDNDCYIYKIDLLHNGGRTYNGELHAYTTQVIVDFKLND